MNELFLLIPIITTSYYITRPIIKDTIIEIKETKKTIQILNVIATTILLGTIILKGQTITKILSAIIAILILTNIKLENQNVNLVTLILITLTAIITQNFLIITMLTITLFFKGLYEQQKQESITKTSNKKEKQQRKQTKNVKKYAPEIALITGSIIGILIIII